jgi:hypothetical protein
MAVLFLAGEAGAQSAATAEQGTSDDAAVRARTLFNEATDHAHRGDWLLALGAFESLTCRAGGLYQSKGTECAFR